MHVTNTSWPAHTSATRMRPRYGCPRPACARASAARNPHQPALCRPSPAPPRPANLGENSARRLRVPQTRARRAARAGLYWACLGDSRPDMPRRQYTWDSLCNLMRKHCCLLHNSAILESDSLQNNNI